MTTKYIVVYDDYCEPRCQICNREDEVTDAIEMYLNDYDAWGEQISVYELGSKVEYESKVVFRAVLK